MNYRTLMRGAAGGLAATVPMTAMMMAAHKRLPRRERYPLPPALITRQVLKKSGIEPRTIEPDTGRRLVLTAHYLYGAAVGTAYGALARHPERFLSGTAFGLAVWAGSYLGWLPLAGVLPPATRAPARRNALMIAAHVVWGACLALSFKRR